MLEKKILKFKYQKWVHILYLDIYNSSYDKRMNWNHIGDLTDSWPLKAKK